MLFIVAEVVGETYGFFSIFEYGFLLHADTTWEYHRLKNATVRVIIINDRGFFKE